MMQFFAHAGDDVPVNTAIQVPPELLIGSGSILLLALLWLLITYVFKWRMGVRLNITAALLLIIGAASAFVAPITATVALACGAALALFTAIALAGSRKP